MDGLKKKKIAVFISGSGSNAHEIYKYFRYSDLINFALLVCNNKGSDFYNKAEELGVHSIFISNDDLESESFITSLHSAEIDFIVLAGFLKKIPLKLINDFKNKIINIHPSLLPKYGGKGMYGKYVHEAVILNKEKESGISIHLVNEQYDEGRIIKQYSLIVNKKDTAISLEQKIRDLEHKYFSPTIEKYILDFNE